jgi:23S rRNA pseudouridine1911/1915/1917 synthase
MPSASTQTQPDLPIIFEDDHLLIIEKPHGVLSQEDHTGDPDVHSLCKEYISRNSGSNYSGLLHRLDRPAGGLMMLAKTPQAAGDISRQIRDRLIQKTYYAVVEGEPPTNGLLTHYLLKHNEPNWVETVSEESGNGKEAVLSFARIAKKNGLALLSVHLQTGRTHQIRVQLSAKGYPIWGDYKYGRDQPDGRTMALRSAGLVLNHPKTGKEMRFELETPDWEPWNRL